MPWPHLLEAEKYSKHNLYADVMRAIINNNHLLLKSLLQECSLLRQSKFDIKDSEYLNFINEVAEARSPQVIFEILAAGFPVYDLIIAYRTSNKLESLLSLYMLSAMLPGLTNPEHAVLTNSTDALVNSYVNQLNRCVLTFDVPLVPCIFFNGKIDFLAMMDGIYLSRNLLKYGYGNQLLINMVDELILDLASINEIRDFIASNAAMQNVGRDLINPFWNENNAIEIDPLISKLREIKSVPLSFISKLAGLAAILGVFMVVSLANLFYEFARSNFVEELSINDLPSLAGRVSIDTYIAEIINYFKMTLSLTAVSTLFILINLYRDNKDFFVITDWENFQKCILSFADTNSTLMNVDLKTFHNITDTLVEAKGFDFANARRSLPKLIATRFNSEFKQKSSPPLLFWKQAFEKYTADNEKSNTVDEKVINTPVFKPNVK